MMVNFAVRKTFGSVIFYILMSCIFYSCSAPKKIVEPTPTVVTKKLEFDPAIHFDESALRLYRLAKAFPFSVQQKMQYASKDSVQIRFTKFAKASVGFLKNGEDIFQPQKNAMVDAGLVNKLFLALACAKKMKIYGASAVSYNSTMITEAAGKNLPGSYNDWYAPKGRPNIGQYLRRMLTQNDVEAYNRILELVTIPYFNEFVKANGWNATLINSRLGRQYSAGENATMNLINFYDDNNRKIYSQQSSVNNAVNLLQRK